MRIGKTVIFETKDFKLEIDSQGSLFLTLASDSDEPDTMIMYPNCFGPLIYRETFDELRIAQFRRIVRLRQMFKDAFDRLWEFYMQKLDSDNIDESKYKEDCPWMGEAQIQYSDAPKDESIIVKEIHRGDFPINPIWGGDTK